MKKQVKTNCKIGGLMLLAAILILLFPTVSNASLQSRPNVTSLTDKTASEFFLLCRQMETSSGPLGLNATIEVQDDKVVETSSSNGIDVHMIKNTEYGTAAMLAASACGNCPNGYERSNDSTTQNKSGIMQMCTGEREYVAGIYYNATWTDLKYIATADARYKNAYKSSLASSAYIPGDATYETKKWKSAYYADFVSNSNQVFARSYRGMFNHECNAYGQSYSTSRAAVVSCAGL